MRGLLSDLLHFRDTEEKTIEEVCHALVEGKYSEAEIAAFLTLMASHDIKTQSFNFNIAKHLVSNLQSHAIPVNIGNIAESAIDVCGTGGDGRNTLNISTSVSFVVAACGVPTVKHGGRSVSSKSGSVDVIEHLELYKNLPNMQIREVLEKTNLYFLFAANHHPSMKSIAPTRTALGFRTIFNLLGPLLNPARVHNQLIGVYIDDLSKYAKLAHEAGIKRGWIVRSNDGLDEISIFDQTRVCALKEDGSIDKFEIDPREVLDLPKNLHFNNILGFDPSYNAQMTLNLLKNKEDVTEEFKSMVLINAAAALTLVGKVTNLKEGVRVASYAIQSGTALEVYERLKEEVGKY